MAIGRPGALGTGTKFQPEWKVMGTTKANWGRRLIAASLVALLSVFGVVLVRRSKPPTAPSLRIDLVSCTNVSAKARARGPLSSPPIQKDAEFKVFNRGDRAVRIEKGIIIEEREAGMSDFGLNLNHLFQTNIVGATGTIGSGESRTFIVRFWSLNGRYVGEEGPIPYELRAVCETGPAEATLRFRIWLKGQAWSKHLPRGFLKEVNSYIFASGWVRS
jgi:hypothetical protein